MRSTLLLLLLVASCTAHRDNDASVAARTTQSQGTVVPPVVEHLGPGDVRIVTTDTAIDLALIGDTISTGLSPWSLAKVRRETDTAKVSGTGMGSSIEKMVKQSVASAVGTRVSFPLSKVTDARYADGALHFDWVGAPIKMIDGAKVNDRPLLASFAPADAERFAAAVHARKAGARTTP